jgi:hypothetical protein
MFELMLWHSQNSSSNGLMKHQCDSKAWKHIQQKFLNFAIDPQNVHLGFATNGVNPFKLTWSTRSTLLVMLLNYNLPLWLTFNFFFILLTLLIPRKESVTSNHFDVYLQPLIEEFQQLWISILSYNVQKPLGSKSFALKGMLIWTIHNFLGYGIVAGVAH